METKWRPACRQAGSSPLSGTIMQKVLVIVGPTASGKSDLAVSLAKHFNGEIISADSRQVYKGLDLGTGKITKKEMQGIPHYLLDVADPAEVFSAAEYKSLAMKKIHDIEAKKKLPIICGGTGFYVDSVAGILDLPPVPPNRALRKELEKMNEDELYKMLEERDPRRAESIDKRNKVRVIRAIEVCEALGRVPALHNPKPDHRFIFIGLDPDALDLDSRIKKRLLERIEEGMIEEARMLHQKGLSYDRMHALGLEYRYTALYLQDKMTKEEMTSKLYTEIRRYSKRQMTWFKRNKDIRWFNPNDKEKIIEFVEQSLS
jgi:tRNA dimethylallyltransferase